MEPSTLVTIPKAIGEALRAVASSVIVSIHQAAATMPTDHVLVLKILVPAEELPSRPSNRVPIELLKQTRETVQRWAAPTAQGLLVLDTMLHECGPPPPEGDRVFLLVTTIDEVVMPMIVGYEAPIKLTSNKVGQA